MDPSIMKLLEDDEDESMHSGADVEAFTAALNRDIGGDASSVFQPPEANTVGELPQGSISTLNQMSGQWQSSSQDGNLIQKVKQQEEQQNFLHPEQHASQMEVVKQPSGFENHHQQIATQPAQDQLRLQQEQSHTPEQQRQAEPTVPQSIEITQVHVSDENIVQCRDQDSRQISESRQQYSTSQLNNQQNPSLDQASNVARRIQLGHSVPFHMLLPILLPHLDKDRSMQVHTVFAKLKANEVNRAQFIKFIRNIVGDPLIRQALNKLKTVPAQNARNSQTTSNQLQSQAQASSQQLPSSSSQQFTEARFSQLHAASLTQHQKGHKSPPHQSQVSASIVQMQIDAKVPTLENSALKSKEIENQSDGLGLRATQVMSTNMNMGKQEKEVMVSLPAVNKQRYSQLPPASFSTYGGTVTNFNTHTYPRPPASCPPTSVSLNQDSQVKQIPRPQGMTSTQRGETQPLNLVNVSKYELQNAASETKRLHSGSLSHFSSHSLQQNQPAWQPPVSEEQLSSGLSSASYVKQEVVEQSAELQQKPPFSASQGSFGAVHIDQGNPAPGSSKDDSFEMQSSRMGYTTSTNMISANLTAGSVATQLDPMMQMRSQISSSTPAAVSGVNARTPPRKPSAGQKKSSESLGTPSPMANKKQKVSGAYLDQSIEQLNDVTAVSGVNLREEEEQLLSAPKEESRASEATRRVVQEEEERLILQKGPLQKKLAEIMFKCGIKNLSSDVDRCLSMSVEERLRGLICNLIRLSKQRVDVEKAQHRIVFTSDVRRQILLMNRKAKEDWEKKQAEEAEKLRKLGENEGSAGADSEKDKEDGRSKVLKPNKEEDDKMRTTAANVAARAAVGGDDMLSKWQLMAEQARQKREGGAEGVSTSPTGKVVGRKPSSNSARNSRHNHEGERKGPSSASTSGAMRKPGRNPGAMPHSKVAHSISTKDVIGVLEREPQMAKSALLYRLYERVSGDSAATATE